MKAFVRKYAEAIIAISMFLVVIAVLWMGFMYMITLPVLPEEGVWYCKELDATIDCNVYPTKIVFGDDESVRYNLMYGPDGTCIYYTSDDKRTTLGSLQKHNPLLPNSFVIQGLDGERYIFRKLT